MYKDARYENLVTEELFKYIKAAFWSKRKNIVNNLASSLDKASIKEKLQAVAIDENERAENISIEKFIEMIKAFES